MAAGIAADSRMVFISQSADLIEPMAPYPAHRSEIEALHVASPDAVGGLRLGDPVPGVSALPDGADQLRAPTDALSANAEVRLFGSDVATAEAGVRFGNELAQLMGADVAGASDFLRHHARGADSVLESVSSMIATEPLTLSEVLVSAANTKRMDTNGDGRTDLLVQNPALGEMRLFQMDAGPLPEGTSFVANTRYSAPVGWRIFDSSADFNGDLQADLVWQGDDVIALWTMNGLTIVEAAAFGTGDWRLYDVHADFNGDRKSDIVWQRADGGISLWTMDGTTITAGAAYTPDGWALVPGKRDLNGDSKTDLIWRRADSTIAIWLMDGVTPTLGAPYGAPPGWKIYDSASDFNGDGKSDIVWEFRNENTRSSTWTFWTMDGASITACRTQTLPEGWRLVDADSDFNGDGKSDVLWASDETIIIWTMDGVNPLQAQAYNTRAVFPGAARLTVRSADGDFNGDGKNDVLFGDPAANDRNLGFWMMDGTNISSSTFLTQPDRDHAWTLIDAESDFNGDGKSDVVMQSPLPRDGSGRAGDLKIWTIDAGAVTGERLIAPYGGWTYLTGKQELSGSPFADTLRGGAGSDTIWGGGGADVLYGGSGRDTFVYRTLSEAGDVIMDFNRGGSEGNNTLPRVNHEGSGGDVLDLRELVASLGPAAVVSINPSTLSGATFVRADPDGAGPAPSVTVVTLPGVYLSSLDSDNYVFF